ncbi:MAG: bifunctional phosphopantothenoylcysteine decarboxylase/phosphopantothenate--cysteine ligase CoaBC [Chitinophagaceae bacterium]
MLANKKILIGISASIAAYKTILLVRLLVKQKAIVKVVMTPQSKNFVSPLVLSTLSKNNVAIELSDEHTWANHVQLGRWADVFIIAPLSCNSLAKMANGLCDNLLLAVYLSATCPVVVAPAMDEDMWHHPTTKINLQKLESFGNKVIKVNNGELASGLFGEGRMAEPEEIIEFIQSEIFRNILFKNKKVLITAGPTYEAIDPVRFIGNHSSGKMGFAIANAFYEAGADVTIICGPTHQKTKYKQIITKPVTSSNEMFEATTSIAADFDIIIMSAAVADYTPVEIATQKIKKQDDKFVIQLTKTKDILKFLGDHKKTNQLLIGFALETNDELDYAKSKLKNKNADAIILNSFNKNNPVFGNDKNQISILRKDGEIVNFETKSKDEVALDIVNYLNNSFFTENL